MPIVEFDAIKKIGREVLLFPEKVYAPVGNYYGGPSVWALQGKYYLSVDNWDGHPTVEVSREFYAAFVKEFEGG